MHTHGKNVSKLQYPEHRTKSYATRACEKKAKLDDRRDTEYESFLVFLEKYSGNDLGYFSKYSRRLLESFKQNIYIV